MNKLIIVLAVFIVLVGGFFLFNSYIYHEKQSDDANPAAIVDNAVYDTYTDTTIGLMFEYKTAPDGYVVDDFSEFIGAEDTEVLKVLRVINEREKIELETSAGGREGPPTISLMVFINDANLTASQWIDAVPRFSNIDFAIGAVDRDAVVAGANAVRYRSDGLYQSDNVVVVYGAYIYHFTGSFFEVNSPIHTEFNNLINSLTFIPTDTMPSNALPAKIDPRVACESALAYMTFPTGVEADAFVAACVNGEHSEVIDRYIKDMGLNSASI